MSARHATRPGASPHAGREGPLRAALLAVLWLALAGAAGAAGPGSEVALGDAVAIADETSGTVAVGVIVYGREVGTLDMLPEGDSFLIPLAQFAAVTGCRLEQDEESVTVITPLGAVELARDELLEIDATLYISPAVLEARLATRAAFDRRQFALLLDIPWRFEDLAAAPRAKMEVTPDARPPRATVSTVRADITHVREGDEARSTSNWVATGRLAGGWWRARYDDDFADRRDISEWAWVETRGRRLTLLGQQVIALHPLLDGFELTGAQLGWTNRPLELFARAPNSTELLPRRLVPVTSFRGPGPPGGLAELRVDGRPVARQVIGMDGAYEFLDVPLPPRQVSQVEVLVFDRRNLEVPVAVHDKSRSTSEFLLEQGTVVHLGGVGFDDGVIGNTVERSDDYEPAGFYQFRRGLTRDVTVEATAQHTFDGSQAVAGVVARLGRFLVGSLGAGISEGGWAYDGTLEGLQRPWRLYARSQVVGAGYRQDGAPEVSDHYLELAYSRILDLEFSLIGRRRDDGLGITSFVLPALYWRPTHGVALRAQPDYQGDYRADLTWQRSSRIRFGLSYQDRWFSELTYQLADRTLLVGGADAGGDLPERYSLELQWYGRGRLAPNLYVGGSHAGGEPGWRVGGRLALWRGVLATVDVRREPGLGGTELPVDTRIVLGLNADLAVARGRLVPASTASTLASYGSIAGAVQVPAGVRRAGLDGLGVLVNGRPATRTESGGNYFVGNLPAGLYRVELEIDRLPIELQPVRVSLVAEVAAGAVTRADFMVRPEFGLAGRLTAADGSRLGGVEVELIDQGGATAARAVSDEYGLFRIDGVPPGTYTLRVAPGQYPEAAEELPKRQVVVTGDFLFEQDLVLPVSPPALLEPLPEAQPRL
jgi:hypothetical protein